MTEEAVAECKKAVELSGGRNTRYRAELAYPYAVSGRRSEARKILDELLAELKRSYIWRGEIALIYAGLGEKDQVFQWLEKSYQEHDLTLVT